MKDFDKWNNLKKNMNSSLNKVEFKERDIFYTSLGKNIGTEEDGKNDGFERPVIVLRKFSKSSFIAVPLTSRIKESMFYYNFTFSGKKNGTILSQIKLADSHLD